MNRALSISTIVVLMLFAQSCTDQQIANISINTDIAIEWEEKVPCEIFYDGIFEDELLSGAIEFRGGFSRQYEKNSFSLELTESHSISDLPADDDWILNANYIDKTFMRHKISYDLFRQMDNSNIAPQSAYVNLEVNEEDLGLYVLMEEINAALLNLDKKDTMAVLFKDPPVFYRQRLTEVEDEGNYYQQKFPRIETADKTWYMEAFKSFLFESEDELFAAKIGEWVDIDNVMDWHILLLFTNNGDGIMKNFYLYKTDASAPLRFAIWDYDHSFGRDGDNELNMLKYPLNWHKNILLSRLMDAEGLDYPDLLKARWFELRELGILSKENMEEHISRNNEMLCADLPNNFSIWPPDSKWYFDANTYEEEIDLMREFTEMNVDRLDEMFSEGITSPQSH